MEERLDVLGRVGGREGRVSGLECPPEGGEGGVVRPVELAEPDRAGLRPQSVQWAEEGADGQLSTRFPGPLCWRRMVAAGGGPRALRRPWAGDPPLPSWSFASWYGTERPLLACGPSRFGPTMQTCEPAGGEAVWKSGSESDHPVTWARRSGGVFSSGSYG